MGAPALVTIPDVSRLRLPTFVHAIIDDPRQRGILVAASLALFAVGVVPRLLNPGLPTVQERLRSEQRVVLAELAEALIARAPDGLDPQFRALFAEAGDDASRLRVVVDQIAALTDASARRLHARLTTAPH